MSKQIHYDILSLLEDNAQLTSDHLAKILDEPMDKIEEILQELYANGVIVKRRTIINWHKMGRQKVSALIDVKVTPQQGCGFDALVKRIDHYPEVRNVYLMSGAYDLSVSLEVDSLEAVGRFVTEKLAPLDFVVSTTTHFVMKKYKHDGVIIEHDQQDPRLKIIP